jgi:hypothetical protein
MIMLVDAAMAMEKIDKATRLDMYAGAYQKLLEIDGGSDGGRDGGSDGESGDGRGPAVLLLQVPQGPVC